MITATGAGKWVGVCVRFRGGPLARSRQTCSPPLGRACLPTPESVCGNWWHPAYPCRWLILVAGDGGGSAGYAANGHIKGSSLGWQDGSPGGDSFVVGTGEESDVDEDLTFRRSDYGSERKPLQQWLPGSRDPIIRLKSPQCA